MISTSGSDAISERPGAEMVKLPVTADSKGRLRVSKEQRRVILAEFEHSGLSSTQFARQTGLKYSTLAAWVQRYCRRKRPARKSPLRLLEAVVTQSATVVVIQLPGGARLEITQPNQIPLAAALVRAMEKAC